MIDNSLPPMGKFYTEAKAKEMVLKALEDVKAKVEDMYGVTEGRIRRPMIDKYELLDFINQKIKECTHENIR